MAAQRRGSGWIITIGLIVVAFLAGRASVNTSVAPAPRAATVATPTPLPKASAPSTAAAPATTVRTPVLPSPPAGQPTATLYVNASTLNVRSSPSAAGARVTQLARGDALGVLEVQGEWVAVVTPSGERGWVNRAYLANQPIAAAVQAPIASPPSAVAAPKIDREKVIRAIMAQSLASYSGNCPCPDNRDRAGRRCGGRSAWSRGGGASPLCYASDVTQGMIDDYLSRR
jgi:SH3-like domain-containing protein